MTLITLAFAAFLMAVHPAYAKSHRSTADGCASEVRLDADGGSMHDVPVTDQGDFGDCYAATEAEMEDAYRNTHGGPPGFHTSTIDGSIGVGKPFHLSLEKALDENGVAPCDVFDYHDKAGDCAASAVEGNAGPLRGELKFLAKSWDIQSETPTDECGKKVQSKDTAQEVHQLLKDVSCTDDQAQDEKLATTRAELLKVLSAVTNPIEARVSGEIDAACNAAGRKPPIQASCAQSYGLAIPFSEHEKTKKLLLAHLDSKQAQPIAIGYCSNVLSAGRGYVGVNAHPTGFNNIDKCDCGGHWSVVIGKRRNSRTGACELLIQNSWGTDCNSYSKDWKCEKGKVWVDADVLSKNVERYNFLK